MKRFLYFGVLAMLAALSGCAHANLYQVRGNQYTVSCNDCSESDWAKAAVRFCTWHASQVGGEKHTPEGTRGGFIKYRPVTVRTYQCGGRIVSSRY
jgi:hypothetical protein